MYGNTNTENNSYYKSFTDIPSGLSIQCIKAFKDYFLGNADGINDAFSNVI